MRTIFDESFRTLDVESDGDVVVITLDHTDNELNLFTWERMEELAFAMSALRAEVDHGRCC